MTAALAHEPEPTTSPMAVVPVAQAAPAPVFEQLVPPEVLAAESHWWRGLVVGIAFGIPVCSLVWMGLVALAIAIADPGWPVWPAVGMAAGVGVFAGCFLGGWAGVTACAERLDEAELHSARPTR